MVHLEDHTMTEEKCTKIEVELLGFSAVREERVEDRVTPTALRRTGRQKDLFCPIAISILTS